MYFVSTLTGCGKRSHSKEGRLLARRVLAARYETGQTCNTARDILIDARKRRPVARADTKDDDTAEHEARAEVKERKDGGAQALLRQVSTRERFDRKQDRARSWAGSSIGPKYLMLSCFDILYLYLKKS